MNIVQQLLTKHMDIWTAADTGSKFGRGRSASNGVSVYGIKKLRGLILELAVSGRLLPLDGIWKQTTLGTLGVWAVGSGFPTSEQGNVDGEILFAKVSDMNLPGNEKFIVKTNNTVTAETVSRIKINVHPVGTVVFPKIGGAISTNKRRILLSPTAIDNNCLGLTPHASVSTEWLYLQLSSIDLSVYQAGTSVPALAQGVLQKIPVLLPEKTEQLRIVAKVDELMALCDQLEARHTNAAEAHEKLVCHLLGTLTQSQNAEDFSANWQRIAAHFDTLFTTEASIDAFKQTLLQLAVMGKLVPQNDSDEAASELLDRIQAEKARLITEGKLKKDKPREPMADEENLFEVPQSWKWTTLASVSVINPRNNAEDNSPASFITMAMIGAKFNSLHGQEKRLWKEIKQGFTHFAEGDIGIAKITPCFENSKACVFSGLLSGIGAGTTELHIVRPINATLAPRYVLAYLKSPQFLLLGESKMTGTAGQKRLPKEFVESNPFPLPPLAEQHRIVAKVDELVALCDQIKSRMMDAHQIQKKLTDVLVEQAVAQS